MALHLLSKCGHFSKTNLVFRFYTSCIRRLCSKPSNILSTKKNNIVFTRTFFWQIFRKPSSATLRRLDNIPEHYEMIYKNGMSRYMLSAQIISVGAAVLIILSIPYNMALENTMQSQKWGNPDQPKPKKDELLIFVASFILFCTILQSMIHKMPLRIYSYPKKGDYVFVFYGVFPTTRRQLTCKLNDISKVEPNDFLPFLPWRDSRIEIARKQKAIVLTNFFRRPADLNLMLGYQKQEADD